MKLFFPKIGRISIAVACFCSLALFVGCSGDSLPTEHVTGTVTLDGQPLADATILFNPIDGSIPAFGNTNAKGVYLITAMQGGRDGAGTVPGEYIVTVKKIEFTNRTTSDGRVTAENNNVLHPVYALPAQTPFRATVVKGKNRFDFALETQPSVEYQAPVAPRMTPDQRAMQ